MIRTVFKDNLTAAGFEQYALQKANDIFREHDQLIVTGGTGLYIKAFVSGFDTMPAVPDETREIVRLLYRLKDWMAFVNHWKKKIRFFQHQTT